MEVFQVINYATRIRRKVYEHRNIYVLIQCVRILPLEIGIRRHKRNQSSKCEKFNIIKEEFILGIRCCNNRTLRIGRCALDKFKRR